MSRVQIIVETKHSHTSSTGENVIQLDPKSERWSLQVGQGPV